MGTKPSNVDVKDRIKVAKEIIQAAQVYKSNLVGKTFMYVFDNRCIEVIFKKQYFSHLTGVETTTPSTQFYNDAIKGRLRYQQIDFSDRYPYSLSVKKVNQLLNIRKIISEDLFILETLTTQTATYTFGILDLEFTICVDKDLDFNGKEKSRYFVPISLRIEDSFKRGNRPYEVNMIFKKSNDQDLYVEITYTDDKQNITELPDEIKSKLDIPLLLGLTNTPQEEHLKKQKVI